MPRRDAVQRPGVRRDKLTLSKIKQAELSREIKNFNRRVQEAANRGIDKSILPAKIKVSEIKAEVKTISELNKRIRQLKKATAKTLVPTKSGLTTKYQVQIEKENQALAQRQRRAALLKQGDFGRSGRRFPTQRDWLLKNIGITDEDTADEMLSKLEGWLKGKNLERSEQWRQNYLRTIDDNIKMALASGDSLSADALEALKQQIEQADLIDFLTGQLANPNQLAIGYLIASPLSEGLTGAQMEDQMSAYNTLIQAWQKYLRL